MGLRLWVASALVLILSTWLVVGCSEGGGSTSAQEQCIATAQWEPQVAGSVGSATVSDSTLVREDRQVTGPLAGLSQSTLSKEIQVTFDVPDLGANGSLTLEAKMTDFPSELSGSAYPVLVGLHDGTRDLINLARTGASGDCLASGYFTCPSGTCTSNPSCAVRSPSAFVDRGHWQQFQIPPFGYSSVNTFPTCLWSASNPSCIFNDSNYFPSPKLRSGTYTATYVLLTSNYASITSRNASFQVTLFKKYDATYSTTATNGKVNLNVILVGKNNIDDSHSSSGQSNLNMLLENTQTYLNQTNLKVKLGEVKAYEWGCEDSGESLANQDLNSMDELYRRVSSQMPSSPDSSFINIILVSTIPDSQNGLSILGVSSGIRGPLIQGSGGGGLAVSTFESLAAYSPQSEDFVGLGETIAHELGHYLGLNHPSESDATQHDYLPDTPQCSTIGGRVTHASCLAASSCSTACVGYNGVNQFCPQTTTCQFNHLMWYTTKFMNTQTGQGDGDLISAQSSRVILFYPGIQ